MRLSELLELDDNLPEGADTLLEPSSLSPEEESRILAMTLAKAGLSAPEKGEVRPMKKAKFGLLLFAAALCVGTVAASAAGYFKMNKDLARHLNAGEQEAALVSQAGLELNESAAAEGWTITAAQAMGDKTQVRVLLEVIAPEGTVLEEGNYRLDLPMIEPSVSFTIDDVEDDDPTDNKLAFVLSSIQAKDYRGKTMQLHIGGVSRYKKYTIEELNNGASPLDTDRLVTANFDMSFKLDYEDTSVTYKLGKEIDTAQGRVKVDEVTLSPLSIFVKLSGEGTLPSKDGIVDASRFSTVTSKFTVGDSNEELDAMQKEVDEWKEGTYYIAENDESENDIKIYSDGNAMHSEYGLNLEVRDKAGNTINWRTGDTNPDNITLTFAEIIDPSNVACIVLSGVEIPLEK